MSLTQDDLLAIKAIVDTAAEDSDQRIAAGFAEVHEKFAVVNEKLTDLKADVQRIENRLTPTIEQVDEHEVRLSRLEGHTA